MVGLVCVITYASTSMISRVQARTLVPPQSLVPSSDTLMYTVPEPTQPTRTEKVLSAVLTLAAEYIPWIGLTYAPELVFGFMSVPDALTAFVT